MSDIGPPALETPASEEQQPEDHTYLDTDGNLVETEVGEEAPDEEDELDFGFKKYRVPKSLKDGVEALRADHTQKTQTAAARQKALDDREASISQQAEVTEAELDARAIMRRVTKELERFADYDFAAYQEAHNIQPMQAEQAWAYKRDLMDQKADLEQTLGKAQYERTEKAHQDLGKRVQETLAEAPKIIPGFNQDTIPKLVDFLQKDMGIPDAALQRNWSPTFLRFAYLANLGHQLTKKAAAKPQTVASPAAQPLQTVRPTNPPPPAGLSDRLSADEWVKRREAQIRKKRAS